MPRRRDPGSVPPLRSGFVGKAEEGVAMAQAEGQPETSPATTIIFGEVHLHGKVDVVEVEGNREVGAEVEGREAGGQEGEPLYDNHRRAARAALQCNQALKEEKVYERLRNRQVEWKGTKAEGIIRRGLRLPIAKSARGEGRQYSSAEREDLEKHVRDGTL